MSCAGRLHGNNAGCETECAVQTYFVDPEDGVDGFGWGVQWSQKRGSKL